MLGPMLKKFASLLGLEEELAEAALHSEGAARHVLSRRAFFGVQAAMASGIVFADSLPSIEPEHAPFFGVDREQPPRLLSGAKVDNARFNQLLKELYRDKGPLFAAAR